MKKPSDVPSIMLAVPISGFSSSLYTFIVFVSDLFPASSITFIPTMYSPSVFICIGVSMLSTFSLFFITPFVFRFFTVYTYPSIFPLSSSLELPFVSFASIFISPFICIHAFPCVSAFPWVWFYC